MLYDDKIVKILFPRWFWIAKSISSPSHRLNRRDSQRFIHFLADLVDCHFDDIGRN